MCTPVMGGYQPRIPAKEDINQGYQKAVDLGYQWSGEDILNLVLKFVRLAIFGDNARVYSKGIPNGLVTCSKE